MRSRSLALLVSATLLVAACGESKDSTSSGSASGGTLKIGTINYIDSLNPYNYIEAAGYNAQLMVFPTLVQYAPGAEEFEGDLADSWQASDDGLTLTFTLKTGGKWSDGKPITSQDVAFTVNTTVAFQDGPTGQAAGAVSHVVEAAAPDDATVVLTYDAPVANALPLLQTLVILPKHVWEPLAAGDGEQLKTFAPQESLPMVSGGAYSLEKWDKKGTSVLKANPDFYGPKSKVDAIALVYYTNEDAMLADLKSGEIDWVDEVPITAATSLAETEGIVVNEIPGAETTNITWNSNPNKTTNRELLDPKVKKALSMTVDRDRIIEVVFGGHANTVESLLGNIVGSWENKNLGPLVRDVEAANAALDELGYERGPDGIRVVPATDEQAEHPMKYEVMVPDSLNFNGKREFEIIKENFAEAGVELTLLPGSDSTASYAIQTGDDCDAEAGTGYTGYDIALWDWVGYKDPDFMLSVVTTGQWCSWSDTGYSNAEYDEMYATQATLIDEAERKALIDEMQQHIYDNVLYTQLVNMNYIEAYREGWQGFRPELSGYSKRYYTDVSKAA
jgi:peptide/nickel transport system substrate-binding protein